MKTKLLFTLLAVSVLMGCKKDDDTTNTASTNCYLKSYEYKDNNEVYKQQLTYDTQNRVVKVEEFEDGGLDYYYTLTYTGNQGIIKSYEGNGTLDDTEEFEMNNGRITKKVYTDNYTSGGYNYTYEDTDTYEYNADGYLMKKIGVSKYISNNPNDPSRTTTYTTNYTWSNGNLIETKEIYGNNSYTKKFDYYLDKDHVQNMGDEAGDINLEDFLTGKQSKNLLKTLTRVDIYSGTSQTNKSDFTYEFDAAGKPNKILESYTRSDGSKSSYAYTMSLSCN